MVKKEYEDAARIFGNSAHTLGVVADAAFKADDFNGKQMIAQNIIPSIVLKSFSCELFLKSLTKKDVKKIHRLDELYNELDEYDKNNIKNRIQAAIKDYNINEFDNDLKDISNAFVDWRYFFEDTNGVSIKIVFFNTFFEVLWNYNK